MCKSKGCTLKGHFLDYLLCKHAGMKGWGTMEQMDFHYYLVSLQLLVVLVSLLLCKSPFGICIVSSYSLLIVSVGRIFNFSSIVQSFRLLSSLCYFCSRRPSFLLSFLFTLFCHPLFCLSLSQWNLLSLLSSPHQSAGPSDFSNSKSGSISI